MTITFRERLTQHQLLLGTIISLPSAEIGEILAQAGFDWLFLDLEHSSMTAREAQIILQAVAGRVASFIRVPLNDEIWIKKCLDSGADGVIIPQVNTREEAQRAVRFCKYPPEGTRSVGISRAHGYGTRFQLYLEQANQSTSVILQIESVIAMDNIDAIISVEGVDALFIGPYDLSASMNLSGQIDHPQVQAALTHIRQACQARNMPVGIFSVNAAGARAYQDQGYTLVVVSSDGLMLTQAAGSLLQSLRG